MLCHALSFLVTLTLATNAQDHDGLKLASLSDIFVEFEGLRDVPQAHRPLPTGHATPPTATTPWSQVQVPAPVAALPPLSQAPTYQPTPPAATATSRATASGQPSPGAYPIYSSYPVASTAAPTPTPGPAPAPAPAHVHVLTGQTAPTPGQQQTSSSAGLSTVPQGTQAYTQDLHSLTDMGFTPEQAQRALQACHGQLAPALDALLEGRVR